MTSGARSPLIRAAIVGVTGRMGQALMRAARTLPQLLVSGAVASPDSLALGRDAGEVAGIGRTNLMVTSDLGAALRQSDVVLDFSEPEAVGETLRACRDAHKPLLVGTTGYPHTLEADFDAASADIALLVAPNTSIGIAVLTELTRRAAAALPTSFDVDVLEIHHRHKPDAPSGTALALGRAAAEARGLTLGAGSGAQPGPRPEGQVGFAALRAGEIVGEHTVLFAGAAEELLLTHRATDRAVFARGGLAAALWLASQRPGRYGMADFLGFKTVA